MNSKRECKGCRQYHLVDALWRYRGRWVCSTDCQQLLKENVKHPRTSVDNPSTETRSRIYVRDRTCRWCGTTQNLEIHHIRYRSQGVDHSEANLILLCRAHHAEAHSNKKKWQPVLLDLVEATYNGTRLTVPQFVRWTRTKVTE